MRALVWHGRRDVRVETVPDPAIQEPTDAIVRVTSSGICGSDLHLYEVMGPFLELGDVLGHEPMGIVEEVGAEVEHIRPGDRVVVPFNISCGSCFMCDPGPLLPTAWQAVVYADVPEGGSLAVYGLGPIGQMCVRVARHLGAGRIIAVDLVPERLELARKHGAETVDLRDGDPVAAILERTDGRGADSVIDAVGMEAHGAPVTALLKRSAGPLPSAAAQAVIEKAGVDRLTALLDGIGSVRRGGTLSIIDSARPATSARACSPRLPARNASSRCSAWPAGFRSWSSRRSSGRARTSPRLNSSGSSAGRTPSST